MVNSSAKADDPRRGRQISQGRHQARARQEPPGGSRASGADAGGRGGTERRPRHRGLEDRGGQTRSSHRYRRGPSRSCGRFGKRPVEALTTRPAPGPMRAAEDRPVLRCAYFPLKVCRSGTPALTDTIFILAHPLPLSGPAGRQAKGHAKEFLSAGSLVSAKHSGARVRDLCSGASRELQRT